MSGVEPNNFLPIVLMIGIALMILGAGIVAVVALLASRKSKREEDGGASGAGVIIVVVCIIGGLLFFVGMGALLFAPIRGTSETTLMRTVESQETITAPAPPTATADAPAPEEPTDE